MKVFPIFLVFAALFITKINSISMICEYYWNHSDEYTCLVTTISITTSSYRRVNQVFGTHLDDLSNEHVKFIEILSHEVNYFPHNLESFFPDLKCILLIFSELREIRLADLKPFKSLTHLMLYGNNIEAIEKNLFRYNPDVEHIELWNNTIHEIEVGAFSKLDLLSYLDVSLNNCTEKDDAAVGRDDVQELIKKVEGKCNEKEQT